jgi:hypothetical protein
MQHADTSSTCAAAAAAAAAATAAAGNAFMSELQSRLVPLLVEKEDFWARYFYRSGRRVEPCVRVHLVVGVAARPGWWVKANCKGRMRVDKYYLQASTGGEVETRCGRCSS